MARIFAYIEHRIGVADDSTFELLAASKKFDPAASPTAIVTGCGADLDAVAAALRDAYQEVWKIDHEALAYPNAELVRSALVQIIPPGSIVVLPHAHFGIDLGPGLSVKLKCPYLPDAVECRGWTGQFGQFVRQEFGGQVSAHVQCDISSGAVITIRPGAFKPLDTAPANVDAAPVNGIVVDKSSEIGELKTRRRYLETIAPEAGDVDIKKFPVLVSIGRGIQEKDNVSIAEELAEAMGVAVSCSRPVVDAKWLPKSRQVGSSGQTVKPKVYLACGISGSFQHLAGLKGNPYIVAINKNPKAPIFQAANVGIVDDILEFLPALAERFSRPQMARKKSA